MFLDIYLGLHIKLLGRYMNLVQRTKESFSVEFQRVAVANIKRKLQKEGIDYLEIDSEEFNQLVINEMEILESDTKKIGTGIGLGIALSFLFGF